MIALSTAWNPKKRLAKTFAAGRKMGFEAFELNAVLYAAPSVDMTARVLDVLEDAYQRGIKLVPDEPSAGPAGGAD